MPKLSDTQAVLLTAAAARRDLSVLPPPETIRLKGAALERTLRALVVRGLIAEAALESRAKRSKWTRNQLVVTPAGLAAIGIEAAEPAPDVSVAIPDPEEQTHTPQSRPRERAGLGYPARGVLGGTNVWSTVSGSLSAARGSALQATNIRPFRAIGGPAGERRAISSDPDRRPWRGRLRLWHRPERRHNQDVVEDYSVAQDTIRLENAGFVGLAAGGLAAAAFHIGVAAHDCVFYNADNRTLFFDQDGTGAAAAGAVRHLWQANCRSIGMTGTTLHTVSRLLAAWEREGIVRSTRRHVTVAAPHRLVVLSGSAE